MKTIFRRAVLLLLVTVLIAPAAVSGQEATMPVKLTPYAGNPVLVPDLALAHEAGGAFGANVLSDDGTFYLFYLGFDKNRAAGSVNYATSTDGLEWTKYAGNPIVVADDAFAPNGIKAFNIVLDGNTWVMYFDAWVPGTAWYDLPADIFMATAPSPTGPWTIMPEPVMRKGMVLEWDNEGRYPTTILRTGDEWMMYFSMQTKGKFGLATSPDGVVWTKYDDPTTTTGMYASSDPVFTASNDSHAWDRWWVDVPVVQQVDDGFEMFYAGDPNWNRTSIGYATSADGIHWTRMGDQPLMKADPKQNENIWPGPIVKVNGVEYMYYSIGHNVSFADLKSVQIAVATIERQ